MKKNLLVLGLAVLVLGLTFSAFAEDKKTEECSAVSKKEGTAVINADDMRYGKTCFNKLGRGIVNILTSPSEIPAGAYRVSRTKGDFLGVTLGSVEGFFTFIIRGIVGVFDTATFIIPPYGKPIMQPEYAFQSLEESFHDYQGGSF
jgi:putative exosortase-associated protein (TIGR04073 family)